MSGPTPPRWQKSSPPSAREDFVMVAQKKYLHDGFRKRHDVTYNAIERTEKEIQMM
jgi:hypothetical protein